MHVQECLNDRQLLLDCCLHACDATSVVTCHGLVPRPVCVPQRYKPNRIQWVNELKDTKGNFLPHILDYAIDQTLHW